MLGVNVRIDPFQIFNHFIYRNHIGKLGFHIKQVPLDHARYTVAHSTLGYDGLKPVTGGIHDRMAYTCTGGGAHDNEGIHTQEIQGLGKMGSKEIGRIFFMDDRLLRKWFQLWIDLQPLRVDIQGAHRDLFIPAGKIPLLLAYISCGGMENRNPCLAACFQHLQGCLLYTSPSPRDS